MAAGSGLPLGSVGVSLKKILASGAVKAGERGMYQLGSAVASPEVTIAPAKKAKPATSKRAKAIMAEAPAAQEVEFKPAKKAKATPTKKAKPAAPKKIKPVDAPAADAPAKAEAALV
jgi:hypothetical protein